MRTVVAVCVLLVVAGCASRTSLTFGPGKLTAIQVQARTRSIADTFAWTAAELWDGVVVSTSDPRVAARAALERSASAGAAWSIASGRCDPTSVVEMVVLFSLLTQSYQRPWAARTFGAETAERVVAVHHRFEDLSWETAALVLTDEQCRELRELIDEWIAAHPDQTYVALVRFGDLAGVRSRAESRPSGSGSLLSLFMLDPLSRLDPATHEIEQTRQLGERLLYFAERWPIQIRWHMELFHLRLMSTDEVRRTLAAVDTGAAAASGLPDALGTQGERLVDLSAARIAAEREAAVAQVAAEFDRQRAALWADVDDRQGRLGELLREVRATIEAGDALALNLGSTTRELQALFPQRPDAAPSGTSLADVREFMDNTGGVVSQVGVVASDLRTLVESPGWSQRGDDFTSFAEDLDRRTAALIDRAFLRLAVLIVIAAVAIAGAIVLARRIARPA